MFKAISNHEIIKAGIATCLFCFNLFCIPIDVASQYKPVYNQAFQAILKMDFNAVEKLLSSSEKPFDIYYRSLSDLTGLMIEQNESQITVLLKRNSEFIKKIKSFNTPDALTVRAELEFHQTILYILNEQDFSAALSFRQSHNTVKQVLAEYPEYGEIKKLAGIQYIVLGSSPEKYDWILNLFGLRGDVNLGKQFLVEATLLQGPFSTEAEIWKSLIASYILQEHDNSAKSLQKLMQQNNEASLLRLIAGVTLIKASRSEDAVNILSLESPPAVFYYHRAEALLHKGFYKEALEAYQQFLKLTKAQNLIKDAYFKSGICLVFLDNKPGAQQQFNLGMQKGKARVEADKYAARKLTEGTNINIPLQQVRYYTDGGLYKQAHELLSRLSDKDLPLKKDQVEYYYRKARLAHKQNRLKEAALFYHQVISMTDTEPWYFAPNACLQLGYIAANDNKTDEAHRFFRQAISYKKHEYKNSIDSKARSALAQLKSAR